MNTIGTIGVKPAMDGLEMYNSHPVQKVFKDVKFDPDLNKLPSSAAEVSQNITQNIEETKANVQELQRLSDMVMGHKLEFNVNEELNKVIVKVVNPSTNETIREIPSEEIQKIQVRMKHAIGLLFDEMI
ncbi:MAG: flagellar protein FlaG [Treponema sp.]|nr:flagellar protein FlaG [Treponema sp.]